MNGGEPLIMALAKGRLAEDALALISNAGYDVGGVDLNGRKLVYDSGGVRYIFVKPADVPTYVEHGIADIGVSGKDTLLEENRRIYEMIDLKIGVCRLCVAGFSHRPAGSAALRLRVATKYPNIARSFYEARGEDVEIIRLNGSVELGPLMGLSDVIVDIVESGGTLAANGLSVLEEVCAVSARLAVNKVSLKVKSETVLPFLDKLKAAVARKEAGKEVNDA